MNLDKNVWVVIPAYNEGKRISSVIDDVKKYCKNIIVVDDGSKDRTSSISKSKNVIVLRHVLNLGKGAALKTGCDFAIERRANVLIAVDADGQHEPKEIPKFLKALEGVDIVFGFRKLNKNMPLVLRFGNMFINFALHLTYGMNLRDTQCGYRAFTTNAYKKNKVGEQETTAWNQK